MKRKERSERLLVPFLHFLLPIYLSPPRMMPDTWPLTAETVGALISADENELVEFKREWHDLDGKRGTAEFIKDVLALANTVSPHNPGYILFGVEDKRVGRNLIPALPPKPVDSIQQILAAYTSPVPQIQITVLEIKGVNLSVLRVIWSHSHPHYATRDSDSLSSDAVYVRRGSTIGRATLPEIEFMIRQKDARVGPLLQREPLEIGFLELPQSSWQKRIVARIANVTDERVDGIMDFFEFEWVQDPTVRSRNRGSSCRSLEPGESFESELELRNVHFLKGREPYNMDKFYTAHSWVNLIYVVQYRGRNGLITEFRRTFMIDLS